MKPKKKREIFKSRPFILSLDDVDVTVDAVQLLVHLRLLQTLGSHLRQQRLNLALAVSRLPKKKKTSH
jgi:hypothetical protein